MTRYDPVAQDDRLIEALLSGQTPDDDPVLEALGCWRSSLESLDAADRLGVIADEGTARTPARRTGKDEHRSPAAPRRTARASVLAVGVAAALTMGISQAVAGNPVAPLRYVVDRAVGLGQGIGSPRADDARGPQAPASAAPPAAEAMTGRADARALDDAAADRGAAPPESPAGRGPDADRLDRAPEASQEAGKPRTRDRTRPAPEPGLDVPSPPGYTPPSEGAVRDPERWWWRSRDRGDRYDRDRNSVRDRFRDDDHGYTRDGQRGDDRTDDDSSRRHAD